jgi:hypothetical protein
MDIKITLDVTDRLLEVLERLSRFGQINYNFADSSPQSDLGPEIAKVDTAVKAIAEVTETPVHTEPESVEERDQRVKEGMFTAVKEFSPKPADVSHLPEAPVKRRRTKAQIEEDKENGLDDRFKQLSKEMPDASIDQIREKMYAELAAANVAPDAAAEPAGAVSSPSPDEPGGDDDWVPNWA